MRRFAGMLAALLLILPGIGARPAAGQAMIVPQTIAQTIVDLTGDPVAWKVERAVSGFEQPLSAGDPGFWLGEQGRIAIDSPDNPAALDPGEGWVIPHGDAGALDLGAGLLDLASPAPGEASALLVALSRRHVPGALFGGAAFQPGPGSWELVLVRALLPPGASAVLPASPYPVIAIVSDGEATLPVSGAPATPAAGAIEETPGGATVTAGDMGAVIAAAALLPLDLPPAAIATSTPASAPAGEPGGSITLRLFACEAGVLPTGIGAAHCSPTDRAPDLQIFVLGSGANTRDIDEATVSGDRFTWSGLPDGEYVLNALALPNGFDRFYVAGLKGLNLPPENGYAASPDEGYIVPVSEASGRDWTLNVYLIRSEFAVDLGFRFWRCPAGVTAQPVMAGLGCEPALPPDGFAVDLTPLDLETGDPTGDPTVTLQQADLADPYRPIFRSLRPGPWELSGTPPDDLFGFAMRSSDPRLTITLKGDQTGYWLAIAPMPGGIAQIDVFLLTAPE